MKTTTVLHRSHWASFFIVLVVSLFATVRLQAQENSLVEGMKASLQQRIDNLSATWDQKSYSLPVRSSALVKAEGTNVPTTLAVYSFMGDVKQVPDQQTMDNRLKTLAVLLRKATDEITEVSKQTSSKGQLSQLKPLLKFVGFTVSNVPVPVDNLKLERSLIQSMTMAEKVVSVSPLEALTQVTEKLAGTSWLAQNKHQAYKYLVGSMLSIPAIWKYVEPDFVRLAREGGATNDLITFAKLYMDREPYFALDSRIWKQAPRFNASQLKMVDNLGDYPEGQVTKVEQSDKETRVSIRYTVNSNETWFRFDENTVLVDNDTKEMYKSKGLDNELPLGKTIVIVGCGGKAVEFTYIFPPIKKTLKHFVIDENTKIPTSEPEKIAYFEKHDIMSDSGDEGPIVIYKLSDYIK